MLEYRAGLMKIFKIYACSEHNLYIEHPNTYAIYVVQFFAANHLLSNKLIWSG